MKCTDEIPVTIYTSYLAKVAKLDRSKYEPIFIASRWPKGSEPQFIEFKLLAPDPKLIGGYIREEINEQEYTKIFNNMLEIFNPLETYRQLMSLSGLKFPVLICYEGREPNGQFKFCHRHLVSKWFRDNGFQSDELVI